MEAMCGVLIPAELRMLARRVLGSHVQFGEKRERKEQCGATRIRLIDFADGCADRTRR